MLWFQYLVAPLVAGLVAAYASTYFTARFSFNRFRQEQWWQAKRDAYESIIRALSEIMFNARREITSLQTGGEFVPPSAPDRDKQLTWSLQEIASGGAYIVSDKTVAAVEEVLNALAAPCYDTDPDSYTPYYDAASKALKVIKAEAHRDLGVEG